MKKFTLKDVKILGEGPQIRNAIEQRYNSLEEFYEAHRDIADEFSSLISYLNRDIIVSDSFISKMASILDTDYASLIVPKKTQIKEYVHNIFDNVDMYDQEEDQQMLDNLLERCRRADMDVETAMMYRAKARCYYNTNRFDRSRYYYEEAIDALPKDEANMIILFNIEHTNDLLIENDVDKAHIRYLYIEYLLERYEGMLNDDILFKFYYRSGLSYLHKGKQAKARKLLVKAVEHSTHNRAKASAIASIGLTYKRQKKYTEALKYYMEALSYSDPSNMLTTASIYNNIALAYKCKRDYTNALEYLAKALKISEKENNLSKHLIFLGTQAEINTAMGKKKSYKGIFDILLSTKGMAAIHRPDILNGIDLLIEGIREPSCLIELTNVIIELKDASTNEAYVSGLTQCAGRIYIRIRELIKGEIDWVSLLNP